ncbi:MAG TPA: CRTAC1 family protein, partial [Gemmatimonadaceae bacterium]|nr:CRTAC1 family protein [Gemmatimonadaceae bacterium]
MKRVVVAVALAVAGCRRAAPPPFELLDAKQTGITFANTLPADTSFNILNYLYYYNGGGVAVGDVNNDGLPDLYFTSNLGANRLYLNKGGYRFEDVTDRAGVADSVGWKSGVTMADVNGDGYVDIYVSGVSYLGVHGRNVLYINNHDGTFSDRTKEYGLDFEGYSTQALFFDYDGDGDLDMYLLNHSVHTEHGSGSAASRSERNPRAGDRLYRNDGGHFVDVSAAAGIYGGVFGYGLGVTASDLDGDGCLDLYVANDFQEDDFLYHNNCDGTFTEIGASAMPHTSRSSMGVDAADFNNDGRPDLITADMLPSREDVLKSSATVESYGLYTRKLAAGYHPQLARNALQLNRGAGRFSDIGLLAGVAATDWSWAPLFVDLDNDGRKDLFITSGIYRRPTDLDYLAYVSQPAVQASLARGITRQNLTLERRMPHVAAPNHAFRNTGDFAFTDVSSAWGLGEPGFSNGAAYVDLNNSGALDLVVNRLNARAAIYRNHLREANHAHFLRVVLRGAGANTEGIGAKVILTAGGTKQLLEQMPTRGYESSVDHRLHFGLGSATRADSVMVVWPSRRVQVLTNVAVDTTLTLSEADAVAPPLK